MNSPQFKWLVAVLLVVGFLTALNIFVFVNEYSLLNAEMSNIQAKLELKIENQVGDGSVVAYLAAIIIWTALLGGVLGFVWSKILFPSLPFVEKFMVSLVLGAFVMPLNFVIPAFIVSTVKLIDDLRGIPPPAYYGDTIGKLVYLFSHNQEQGYELFNTLLFIAIGIVILAIVTISRRKSVMSTN
jgi:hypothetical protein